MPAVIEHPEGTVFEATIRPAARRNAVCWETSEVLKVWITHPPEKGKANHAVLKLLAETLGVRLSQLEILSGQTCSHKKILIRDLTPEQVKRKLAALAGADGASP